jgi:hypothetical protein
LICSPKTGPKVRRFFQDAKIQRREYWLHEKISFHLGADRIRVAAG